VADRRSRSRSQRCAAGVDSLNPVVISADGFALIPLTTEVARQLIDGQPLDLDCAPGWPHEDTLLGIRVALEAACDPGWLVVKDGVVVGECAVKGGQPNGTDEAVVEISYGLAGPQRGRGLGTAVVDALTTWLLRQPGIEVVTAEVRRDNTASIRVLEKTGFRRQENEDQSYLCFSRTR
jgi:ribosomal protein S18 acetylase RimI-like enzyme